MEAYLLEKQNIKQAFGPADLDTAQVGARISLVSGQRVVILLSIADSAGGNVIANLKQHNAATAGTSKALELTNPYFHKVGAATVFTKVDVDTAEDVYDLSALLATEPGLVAFEVKAEDLDVEGNFSHISVEMDDSGAAKIGAGVYIVHDCKSLPAYSVAL